MMIEVDGVIAKRFGKDHQWDVAIQPVIRWMKFPWNHWLYTNLRVAPLGLSYVNSISEWEAKSAAKVDHKGSRLLNFFTVEWTFKSAATAKNEVFLRYHHRSGIFGLFNGVHGGSNYTTVGYRHHF